MVHLKKLISRFMKRFQKKQIATHTIYYTGQKVTLKNYIPANYKPTVYSYDYFKIKDIELDNCSLINNPDYNIYNNRITNYDNDTESFYSFPSTIVDCTDINSLISLYEN